MEVTIDETRQKIAPRHGQPGSGIIPQANDDPVEQSHISFLPFTGVDIGHPAAGEHQFRRHFPPGSLEPSLQSLHPHKGPNDFSGILTYGLLRGSLVENSRRRNVEPRWPDQKRAGLGQVDSTETRLFFREGETDCLDVRVGYPQVVVRS